MNSKNQVYNILTKSHKDWIFNDRYAEHNPSGVRYYVGTTVQMMWQSSDVKVSIGFINHIKLFYWLKEARRKQFIDNVKPE